MPIIVLWSQSSGKLLLAITLLLPIFIHETFSHLPRLNWRDAPRLWSFLGYPDSPRSIQFAQEDYIGYSGMLYTKTSVNPNPKLGSIKPSVVHVNNNSVGRSRIEGTRRVSGDLQWGQHGCPGTQKLLCPPPASQPGRRSGPWFLVELQFQCDYGYGDPEPCPVPAFPLQLTEGKSSAVSSNILQ